MMNNNKMNKQTKEYPIPELRETLRQQALMLDQRLNRSVARRTTCDDIPCVEYNQEVRAQYRLAEMLLCIQRCRYALELCMAQGGAVYRCRWADGTGHRDPLPQGGAQPGEGDRPAGPGGYACRITFCSKKERFPEVSGHRSFFVLLFRINISQTKLYQIGTD